MSDIRLDERILYCELSHVYREFNADADAIANETLDRYNSHIHADHIVINDNWTPFSVQPAVHATLMAQVAGGDNDSDSVSSHASSNDDTEHVMNYHLARFD